jgi:hypothetical protein
MRAYLLVAAPSAGIARDPALRISAVRAIVLGALLVCACETVDDRSPTWSYIHAAIIAPSCATASCHSALVSADGRDLSTPEHAYAALTGRTCDAPSHPGEPGLDHIRNGFLAALRADGRALMPPDQPLPRVEIEMIEQWFEAGARCD